jgi:hypothetical protein
LGESFANTTECLSCVFSEGELATYFLEANCHFRGDAQDAETILSAMQKYGAAVVVRILFASFLYSNFLYERLSEKQISKIKVFSGLGKQAAVHRLIRIGLQLNERFRTVTTPFHLWKSGFSDPKVNFDPLDTIREDKKLQKQLSELLQVLTKGLE